MLFCRLLIFLEKMIHKYHQSVKQVWFQIRPGVILGLIWVQTVCKGYQQTTLLVNHFPASQIHVEQLYNKKMFTKLYMQTE